ncbi:MAG: HAD family hydrolase [Ktedonobacterales bacterium]|nr:HAD family hydrolase [Ktedonobacterales bacterium]
MNAEPSSEHQRLLGLAPWLAHPQSIRTIFFDVGFTLLRPHPSLIEVVQGVAARAGFTIPLEDLRARYPVASQTITGSHHITGATWADNATITATWRTYFTALLAPSIPDVERLDDCVTDALVEFDRHVTWQPYPDVLPALARLQAHYTLGIISDWGIGLGQILRGHDLHQFFTVQIVSATSRRAKPDPALFAEALRRGDALGDYTVYVGDTYVQDILGARSVGIHPILIDRRARLDPQAVDCPVIHTLDDLLRLLEVE